MEGMILMNVAKYKRSQIGGLWFILLAVFFLITSCANDNSLTSSDAVLIEDYAYEEYNASNDSLENEDAYLTECQEYTIITHNSITGIITSIEGVNDDSWVAPKYIDWLSFKVKCNDGEQVLIIALRETVRHGEIKIGNQITAYWPIESPVFIYDIPTHVASVIVANGLEYEPGIEQSLWDFYISMYTVPLLWQDKRIASFNPPDVYSRDMFGTLQLPIIAYGVLLEEWPIVLEDGTIMVPLQSAVGNTARGVIVIGSDDFTDGSLFMNVQCGSFAGIRHLAVGSTKVVMAGGQRYMCTAPILVEGIVYVPFISFFEYIKPFVNTSAEIFEDRLEIFLVLEQQ